MNKMNQPTDLNRVRFLEPYEEVIDTLGDLSFADGLLIARFKTIAIAIPSEMEDRIRPFIGKKMGLLRTDIPEKQYLIKLLEQETTFQEKKDQHGGLLINLIKT